MSPIALRAVFGSCLTLGVVDLAWLDANAGRVKEEMSLPPLAAVEPVTSIRPLREAEGEARAAAITGEIVGAGPSATSEPPPASVAESHPAQESPLTSCVVQFERSLAVLHPDQIANLGAIAEALKRDPRAVVRVGGHADRLAWKGNRGNNLTLSEDRAVAVARALGKLGISPDRIRRAAFGDTQPLDERATEDAYRRNRRVEVRVELTGDR